MTWEHPMVRGAMDMLTSAELGAAAVTVCSHPDYRTGTLFLELLYITECVAPAMLEAERYLPPTCHRLLLDTQNRKLAETVIKSQSDKLKVLFQLGDQLVEEASRPVVAPALAGMHEALRLEQDRLEALARVNPNVREDEIEQVAARRELLEIHLGDTRVRLDAVRVVVMR